MAFDPDAYLASVKPSSSFDPDSYLKSKGISEKKPYGIKNAISDIGQQVLPVAGAVGGAMLGGGPTPMGVAGGVGGYAIGQQGANLLSRQLGTMQQPQTTQQALIQEPAQQLYQGAQAEALGLAMPAIYQGGKALVKGAGQQLEQASGIAPRNAGALEAAAEDAGLMFSKGKKAVQSMYEAAKMGQQIKPQLLQMTSKQDFVDAAKQLLDMGQLNPTEALAARKTLDQMKNKMAGEAYRDLRTKFDGVAKQLFQGSDEAYQDALNAEALRNLFPQNKSGGASPFKAAMALFEIGLTPLISPAIQGTAATGMGLANRYAIQPMLSNPMGALGIGAGIVNQGNQ